MWRLTKSFQEDTVAFLQVNSKLGEKMYVGELIEYLVPLQKISPSRSQRLDESTLLLHKLQVKQPLCQALPAPLINSAMKTYKGKFSKISTFQKCQVDWFIMQIFRWPKKLVWHLEHFTS